MNSFEVNEIKANNFKTKIIHIIQEDVIYWDAEKKVNIIIILFYLIYI